MDVSRRITRREGEVLAALGQRLTNAEIADQMFISERTVESHVSSLLRKLGAADRLGLAALANQPSDVSARPPLPALLVRSASAPFVGSALELARARLSSQAAGRRVLWVRGEAGIGKTRLLAALANTMHEQAAAVLYGRCEHEVGGPFHPFREAIRQWAAALPPASVAALAGPHRVPLGRLVPELDDGKQGPLGPADAHLVFEAVDALISALAQTCPTVLLLDDLQWADRSSLLLLGHLARSSRPGDVTIVAAYRPADVDPTHPLADLVADLHRDDLGGRVDLPCLDTPAVGRLVAEMGLGLSSVEIARIARDTAGNPFFVVEIARHLAGGGGAGLPDTVRDVIGRRLSRLPSSVNEPLEAASVIGQEFSAPVVAAALGRSPADVTDALDAAVASTVVEEVPGRFGRYRFAHDLIRQTLLHDVSANRRMRIHWAAGQALLEHERDDLAAIAHHLAEGVAAGEAMPAVDACLTAANAAAASAAWPEAAAAFGRAVALLDGSSLDDPDRRFRALDGLHRAARASADHPTATRAADAAIVVARAQGWKARLARVVIDSTIWRAYERGAGEAGQLALLQEALDALGAGHDAIRAQLMARRSRVRCALAHGRVEHENAIAETEAAVALADGADEAIARIETRDCLGQLLAVTGDAQRHVRIARETVDIADDLTIDAARCDVLLLPIDAARLTIAGRIAGDPGVVAEGLSRMAHAVARTGVPYAKAMLLRFRAGDALAAGRLTEATQLAYQMAATCPHDLNVALGKWTIDTAIGIVRDELDVVRDRVERAIQGFGQVFTEIRFQLAAIHATIGDGGRAADLLTQALEDGVPWTWARPHALFAAGDAASRLGDVGAARELHGLLTPHRGTILAGYDGSLCIEGAADTMIGRLETTLGRLDDADSSFRAGLDLEANGGYHALAARTQTWWAVALTERGAEGDDDRAERLRAEAAKVAHHLELRLLTRELQGCN